MYTYTCAILEGIFRKEHFSCLCIKFVARLEHTITCKLDTNVILFSERNFIKKNLFLKTNLYRVLLNSCVNLQMYNIWFF